MGHSKAEQSREEPDVNQGLRAQSPLPIQDTKIAVSGENESVPVPDSVSQPPNLPTFGEAFRFWLKLGFISFGGPTGQIAIMHSELVEKRRWISEDRFFHALNYCMLLPGPEAQQLAINVGWLLHRTWGGIVAGVLFVIPSALILWGLSIVYVTFGELPWVRGGFDGLKPAILAIVLSAMVRIGRRVLKNPVMWGVALMAFLLIFQFHLPFPLIILAAGLVGLLGDQGGFSPFRVLTAHRPKAGRISVVGDDSAIPIHAKPSLKRALNVCWICLTLWWAPVLLSGVGFGFDHLLFRQGLFFSKAAMVTFGGAYAVLPYVSQEAVENYHWVTAGQMLDGLALAETTPGPLIMVLQFVGFLGGWNSPAPLSPQTMATLGALLTTWTTFLPCFLWIFLGAPHIEELRGNKRISAVLSTITAAVVGVILNLAVWFGIQVIFPSATSINLFSLTVGCVALIGMARWKWGTIPVVLSAGAVGMLWKLFQGWVALGRP